MENLDNIAVAIPINEAERFGSYFWYAIWGASASHTKVFEALPVGTRVNRGDSVYSLKDGSASIRSPINGIIVSNDFSNLMIQPERGYKLSQYDGSFMFGEIIDLIHTIEDTAAIREQRGGDGCLTAIIKLIFNIEDKYSGVSKKTPEARAKFLAEVDKLGEVQCTIRSLKS